MFLCMTNSNYMSNRIRFKDIRTFLLKKLLMRSHVTRNALDDPKCIAMFCIKFYRQSYKFDVLRYHMTRNALIDPKISIFL